MLKHLALFHLILLTVTVCRAQDLTGRKYFSYSDSVFKTGAVRIHNNIYFDFNGGGLMPESFPVVDSIILFLKKNPGLCVEIGCNTDSKGKDSYNFALTNHRANSVYNYLTYKGINSSRLSYKGYGESFPLVKELNPDSSDCVECRQQNRRTEIKITSTDFYYFDCYYKISFLGQTTERGQRIGWTTHIQIDQHTGISYTGKTVWDTGMIDPTIYNFDCGSIDTSAIYEVVVTSCDGTKKSEIEKCSLDIIGAKSTSDIRTGGIIDLKKWCYLINKFPQDFSEIYGIEIYLKGIPESLYVVINGTEKK